MPEDDVEPLKTRKPKKVTYQDESATQSLESEPKIKDDIEMITNVDQFLNQNLVILENEDNVQSKKTLMNKFKNSYSIIQEEDDEVIMSGTNNTVFGMMN